MAVTSSLRLLVAVLLCPALVSCASGDTTDGVDCMSRYHRVASARTWPGLKAAMVRYQDRGPVRSVRIQAEGTDVGSPGDRHDIRVVDLLGRHGRRVAQVDVWRTPAGAWHAGIWSQCID